MISTLVRLIASIVAACSLAGPAAAGDIIAHPLAAGDRIVLDGRLDDAAWQDVPSQTEFYEFSPRDDREASLATSVRVTFDDTYLYVALSARDPVVDGIRAPFARRDKVFAEQDMFQLFIDASGERKSAQFIRVNPRGAIGDGVYTESDGEDFSPDFPFDAAAHRFDDGWSAELRIPFASLGYDGSGRDWTMMVLRNMPRADRIRYANARLPRDNNCLLCHSPVLRGLRDLPVGLDWRLTPQLTASLRSDEARDRTELQASLDAKIRLNPRTVVDLTLNPDFSQVESDLPVLSSNSRFSVLLPEKRPFFLEGADLLVSPFNVMHTRSITDPGWGARTTYRSDSFNLALLTARDQGGGSVIVPGTYGNDVIAQDFSSQATVLRATTTREGFTWGGVLTDRTLSGGRGYNRVIGPDVVWQIGADTRMRAQVLMSSTTAVVDTDGELRKGARRDGIAAYFDISREVGEWRFYGRYRDIGNEFRADNGFFTQSGVRALDVEATRRYYREGIWREISPYLNMGRVQDRKGHTVSQSMNPGVYLAGPRGIGLNFEWRPDERIALAPDAPLLRRGYARVAMDIAPNAWLNRVVVDVELGDQVDYENGRLGRGGLVSMFARWRPFDRFEMEQEYSRFWVDARDGSNDRIYAEDTLSWTSILHFSARDTLRAIWQRDAIRRNPNAYPVPVDVRGGSEELSLVYAHTRRFGSTLYVGCTAAERRAVADDRRWEVFAKASWAF